MAIICRSHRLLFIQAPRTGCTALEQLLVERFSGELLPTEHLFDAQGQIRMSRKHCSILQLLDEGLIPVDYRRQFTTVVTVRNPFDSLVSLYVKKRDKYRELLDDPTSWIHQVRGYVEDMEFCRYAHLRGMAHETLHGGCVRSVPGKGSKISVRPIHARCRDRAAIRAPAGGLRCSDAGPSGCDRGHYDPERQHHTPAKRQLPGLLLGRRSTVGRWTFSGRSLMRTATPSKALINRRPDRNRWGRRSDVGY